jgi:uncharacterized RDD family membrane protein YckC
MPTNLELVRIGLKRFLARALDNLAFGAVLLILYVSFLGWESVAVHEDAIIVAVIVGYVPFDAYFTYRFGRGLGKCVLNLKVVSRTRGIRFSDACKRAIAICALGNGFGIDPLSRIVLLFSGILYFKWRTTAWDEWSDTAVVRSNREAHDFADK